MNKLQTHAAMPTIGQEWEGGTYAGLIHTTECLHHLVLLDDKPTERLGWDKAVAWAKSIDADLPSRVEALVLFKNLPDRFEKQWHWTHEQYSRYDAWLQCFGDGDQDNLGLAYEGRARAVRRFKVE